MHGELGWWPGLGASERRGREGWREGYIVISRGQNEKKNKQRIIVKYCKYGIYQGLIYVKDKNQLYRKEAYNPKTRLRKG